MFLCGGHCAGTIAQLPLTCQTQFNAKGTQRGCRHQAKERKPLPFNTPFPPTIQKRYAQTLRKDSTHPQNPSGLPESAKGVRLAARWLSAAGSEDEGRGAHDYLRRRLARIAAVIPQPTPSSIPFLPTLNLRTFTGSHLRTVHRPTFEVPSVASPNAYSPHHAFGISHPHHQTPDKEKRSQTASQPCHKAFPGVATKLWRPASENMPQLMRLSTWNVGRNAQLESSE